MTQYFNIQKLWKFTPFIQISSILVLFIISVVFGYYEFVEFGTVQGYEGYLTSMFFVPIYEELLFRGLVLGALMSRVSVKKAIIYSSIIFGIWHLKNLGYNGVEQTMRQMIYTGIIVGPIFAYITIRTKSLVPAIVLHYLNNIGAALFLLIS